MKFFIYASMMVLSTNVLAKDVNSFNEKLIQDVQKDIKNDNDDGLKKKSIFRGPASVEANHPADLPQDEQKINKMNVKQLGPSAW